MSNQKDEFQTTLNNLFNMNDLLEKYIVEHTFKKIEEMLNNKSNPIEVNNHNQKEIQ